MVTKKLLEKVQSEYDIKLQKNKLKHLDKDPEKSPSRLTNYLTSADPNYDTDKVSIT